MARSRPYSQPRRAISTSSSPRTRRTVPPVNFTVTLTALTAAAGSATAFTPSVPYPALWPWVTIVVILVIVLIARRPALRGLTVSVKTAYSMRVTQCLKITGPVT